MPIGEDLKKAEQELKISYYKNKVQNIFDLLKYRNTADEAQVELFFRNGFSVLKKATLEHLQPGDIPLINHVAYAALVCAIGEWGKPEFSPILIDEFLYVTFKDRKTPDAIRRHYELMITAGDIAIALAKLGYRGDLSFASPFLSWSKGRFDTSDFLLKVEYLKWLSGDDTKGAREYLASQEKGISLAVTALADLNDQSAATLIQTRMAANKNVIFQEICVEALTRLKSQTSRPASQDLMIRLFGKRTSTELALGDNTDNQFVIRAQNKSKNNSEIGQVTETDDSNFND